MKKLSLLAALLVSVISFAQTDKDRVLETVTKDKIKGHIYFLADDALKGRDTGSPELKIAASYLANTLRSYGVKPNPKTGTYYQTVKLEKVSPPKDLMVTINGNKQTNVVATRPAPVNFNGNTVYLGYGLEDDYQNKEVAGKVIIVKSGSEDAKDARAAFNLVDKKRELAEQHGAIGIIELLNTTEVMWGFVNNTFKRERLSVASKTSKNDEDAGLPYVWVKDDAAGNLAKNLSAKSNISATLSMSGRGNEVIDSQNIIGVVEGTDPKLKDEYIIYSAHYDHVGIGTPDQKGDSIYNGARDNAVGTTTVLAMAESLAKNPTKRSALFILFTGEEKGLLGSRYYVQNPVLPLNKMVYCFNSDNAGYNDTSIATIIGLPRTTAAKHIKEAAKTFGITAVDDPAPEQGLFDRSDNVSFAAKGIPAPTFSLGFRAFNGTVTEYYHKPGDEAHTLDYDYLLKFFRAYVLSGRKIANDPVTPVWTAGDKYEAASKKLYNKEMPALKKD